MTQKTLDQAQEKALLLKVVSKKTTQNIIQTLIARAGATATTTSRPAIFNFLNKSSNKTPSL